MNDRTKGQESEQWLFDGEIASVKAEPKLSGLFFDYFFVGFVDENGNIVSTNTTYSFIVAGPRC